MKKKWHLFLRLGVVLLLMGFARLSQAKHLEMEVLPNDQLVIYGFEGRVRLISQQNKKVKNLEVHFKQENPSKAPFELETAFFNRWGFSLQRKGNVLEASIDSPHSKRIWSKLLGSGRIPQFYMEITSPPIPVEVVWRKGKVNIENWNAPLKTHVLQGEIRIVGGKGRVQVTLQEGDFTLSAREGPVEVESFKGNASIDQVKGRIDLENFSGSTRINRVEGPMNLVSTSGTLKVDDCNGRLKFNNLRANVSVSGFSGELRGRSEAGAVSAIVKGKADVRIYSKEGNVSLRLPNSGAEVNLGTREGEMILPRHLRVSRFPNLRWTKGLLRGNIKGGNVYVRTTEGHILLR